MAIVNKTIGTTGRDYSTIAAWDAADGGGDGLGNDDCTGSCYDDSAFDEKTDITFTANSVVLTVAAGERHDGTAGTGARIVRTANTFAYILRLSVVVTLEWLEIDGNNTAKTSRVGALGLAAICTVNHVIIHDYQDTDAHTGIDWDVSGGAPTIMNSIVYDARGGGALAGLFGSPDGGDMRAKLYNCTGFDSAKYGIAVGDYVESVIQNTISVGADVQDFRAASFSNATVEYNLSSDTSASGTGSLVSKSAANQFVSTTGGSEDLHLKSGADAIDAGTDLVTTPSGVEIDIDGRDRDAEGDTWDMGADEFVGAPAGNALPMAWAQYRRRRVG